MVGFGKIRETRPHEQTEIKQVHEQWLTSFIQLKISRTSERVVALPKGHFHSFSHYTARAVSGEHWWHWFKFIPHSHSYKFPWSLQTPNPSIPSSPIAIVSFASIAIVSLLKVWDRQWRFPSKTSGVVGGYAIFDLFFSDLPMTFPNCWHSIK